MYHYPKKHEKIHFCDMKLFGGAEKPSRADSQQRAANSSIYTKYNKNRETHGAVSLLIHFFTKH